MTPVQAFLVFLAGIAAGAINTVVGSGTLVTFPALIAFGVPPVTATMSNAVGLIPGNITGTWGYRRELEGQGHRLRRQIPASVAGSMVGAWLLLHLPPDAFETIVPILLGLALVLVVTQPAIQRRVRARREAQGAELGDPTGGRLVLLIALTFVTGIYGGYFAAAQGILLIGLMGVLVQDSLQRLNAAKNVLVLLVNLVSASVYVIVASDRIDWLAVGLIAAGSLIGGFVGAGVGRRLSPTVLRAVIVVLGVYAMWRILAT